MKSVSLTCGPTGGFATIREFRVSGLRQNDREKHRLSARQPAGYRVIATIPRNRRAKLARLVLSVPPPQRL